MESQDIINPFAASGSRRRDARRRLPVERLQVDAVAPGIDVASRAWPRPHPGEPMSVPKLSSSTARRRGPGSRPWTAWRPAPSASSAVTSTNGEALTRMPPAGRRSRGHCCAPVDRRTPAARRCSCCTAPGRLRRRAARRAADRPGRPPVRAALIIAGAAAPTMIGIGRLDGDEAADRDRRPIVLPVVIDRSVGEEAAADGHGFDEPTDPISAPGKPDAGGDVLGFEPPGADGQLDSARRQVRQASPSAGPAPPARGPGCSTRAPAASAAS